MYPTMPFGHTYKQCTCIWEPRCLGTVHVLRKRNRLIESSKVTKHELSVSMTKLQVFLVVDATRSLSKAEPSSTRNCERVRKHRTFKSYETWEWRLLSE